MKKWYMIFSILCILLLVAGCGQSTGPVEEAQPEPAASVSPAVDIPPESGVELKEESLPDAGEPVLEEAGAPTSDSESEASSPVESGVAVWYETLRGDGERLVIRDAASLAAIRSCLDDIQPATEIRQPQTGGAIFYLMDGQVEFMLFGLADSSGRNYILRSDAPEQDLTVSAELWNQVSSLYPELNPDFVLSLDQPSKNRGAGLAAGSDAGSLEVMQYLNEMQPVESVPAMANADYVRIEVHRSGDPAAPEYRCYDLTDASGRHYVHYLGTRVVSPTEDTWSEVNRWYLADAGFYGFLEDLLPGGR